MADEKNSQARQGYNPGPLNQALQKGLNPAPLSQAVQQVIQESNPTPAAPTSPDNTPAAGNPNTPDSK